MLTGATHLAPQGQAASPPSAGALSQYVYGWTRAARAIRAHRPFWLQACRRGRASATLPCPEGQGTLRVCVFDAVCPAGKGAAEWRAGFLACRKRKQAPERFAHQVILPARRGTGPSRVSPPGMELYTVPRAELALSRHSFHIVRARHCRRFSRRTSGALSRPVSHPPQNPSFSPFPPPPHPPTIPQGDRRALPAPAQGSRPLRIPFWERLRFPPFTPSPTPQAASPCSWTCRRVRALPPDRNETKQVRPLLMGRTCVTHAPKALAAGPAGSPRRQRHWLAALPPLPHKGR